MRKIIGTILILFTIGNISIFAKEQLDFKTILVVLKKIESNNNPNAIGDDGKAFGILQIHKIYVDEVNQRFGTEYSHKDMFNEDCAEEVFTLYMKYAIKVYYRKYKKYPNEEVIVRSHNGGLYTGYRKKSTMNYYKKYIKWKYKIEGRML